MVAYNYAKGWLVLDLLSTIPFMLIDRSIYNGCALSPTRQGSFGDDGDDESSEGSAGFSSLRILKSLRLLRLMKLGRLIKLDTIFKRVFSNQETQDKFHDFMEMGTTRIFIKIFGLVLIIGFITHVLSCVWVWVGRSGHPGNNWLELADGAEGPFFKLDTVTGSDKVGTICKCTSSIILNNRCGFDIASFL